MARHGPQKSLMILIACIKIMKFGYKQNLYLEKDVNKEKCHKQGCLENCKTYICTIGPMHIYFVYPPNLPVTKSDIMLAL